MESPDVDGLSPGERLLNRQNSISQYFPCFIPKPLQKIIFDYENIVFYVLCAGYTSGTSNRDCPCKFSFSRDVIYREWLTATNELTKKEEEEKKSGEREKKRYSKHYFAQEMILGEWYVCDVKEILSQQSLKMSVPIALYHEPFDEFDMLRPKLPEQHGAGPNSIIYLVMKEFGICEYASTHFPNTTSVGKECRTESALYFLTEGNIGRISTDP